MTQTIAFSGSDFPFTPARLRRLNMVGVAVCACLVFGGGSWATLSRVDSAVIAHGTVAIDGNAKQVNHAEGGIVQEVLVRNGDRVRKGQPVIRLEPVMAEAGLGIATIDLFTHQARLSRLEAELAGAAVMTFPPDLRAHAGEEDVRRAMAAEVRLFESRQAEMAGHKATLIERSTLVQEESAGLNAQLRALRSQVDILRAELSSLQPLFSKGLVTRPRMLALERQIAGGEGQIGATLAGLAKARSEMAALSLQIAQLDTDRKARIAAEHRTTLADVATARQRLSAARERLDRTVLRAPVDGTVHDLAVHSLDAMVPAGETLMLLIPSDAPLLIQTRVDPAEIDRVTAGAEVQLHVIPANARTATRLTGFVAGIAPDVTQDPMTGRAHYAVQVRLAPGDAERGAALIPGMPVDAFIRTGADRTPMQYLLEPLTEQMAFAWRER